MQMPSPVHVMSGPPGFHSFVPPPRESSGTGITAVTLLFFGSLVLLYNPFFRLQPEIKFPAFVGMQLVALIVAVRQRALRGTRPSAWVIIFSVLFVLAVMRVKEIETIGLGYQRLRFILMAGVTLFAFLGSYVVAPVVDITGIRRSLMLVFTPVSIELTRQFGVMGDWASREYVRFGEFSFDSYQQVSLVLSLTTLGFLGELKWGRRYLLWNTLLLVPIVYFGYYIFQGLARGEAIAFAFATGLMLAPRVTVIAIPFYASILSLVVTRVDSSLAERLGALLAGDYGMRDILFSDSLTMLAEQPYLLFIGGGLNAFQEHYGLSSGMYPHNVLVEALITGGVALGLAMFWIYVRPLLLEVGRAWARRSTMEERYGLGIGVFLMIVMLKSGSLCDMWTLTLFTCLFMKMGGHRGGLTVPLRPAKKEFKPATVRP
jgi:hypothetical protein